MGTNYYLQKKINKDGRRWDIHIGKTSNGWYPHLQGYRNSFSQTYPVITSWFDWKTFLRAEVMRNEGLIFNEYDELIEYEEFVKIIEDWQNNAILSNWKNPFNSSNSFSNGISLKLDHWQDPENFWLSSEEFS
jgi:hypothetical protein